MDDTLQEILRLSITDYGANMITLQSVCKQWHAYWNTPKAWSVTYRFLYGTDGDRDKFIINYKQLRDRSPKEILIWSIREANSKVLTDCLTNHPLEKFALELDDVSYLYLAAVSGCTSCILPLIKYFGMIKGQEETSPLYISSQKGHLEVVKLLVENGIDIDFTCKKGFTPLYVAAKEGHLKVVQYLYENGADIRHQCHDGSTPVYIAAKYGQTETVKYLLSLDPGIIKWKSKPGYTALYVACRDNHVSVVRAILDVDVDLLDMRDAEGATPLYVASQNGNDRIVQVLLEYKPSLESTFMGGYGPLYIASQNGHSKIVKLLCEHGADPDVVPLSGSSALYVACQNGHTECVQHLLRHNADVNITFHINGGDCWCLHVACHKGNVKVVEELLKSPELDVNILTSRGSSALYIAANKGFLEIVKLLIAHGANPYLKFNNLTPLDIARKNNHNNVAKYLKLLTEKCNPYWLFDM